MALIFGVCETPSCPQQHPFCAALLRCRQGRFRHPLLAHVFGPQCLHPTTLPLWASLRSSFLMRLSVAAVTCSTFRARVAKLLRRPFSPAAEPSFFIRLWSIFHHGGLRRVLQSVFLVPWTGDSTGFIPADWVVRLCGGCSLHNLSTRLVLSPR